MEADARPADVIPRSRARVHVHDDSRRWDRFEPRADDIFVTTPPKSGTTWTQGIIRSLLWPDGDAPAPAFDLSPWLDFRLIPLDDVLTRLAAMPHRRFIKTHSPADCVPIFRTCRYVAVYRDPRDALVSWANHRSKLRPEVMEAMNAHAVADEIVAWPPVWDGDMHQLFDEWVDWGTPMEHLASWWPLRHEPFVLLVHYADLLSDLDGEMNRIADFIGVNVPRHQWPEVVERCRFESMKRQHEASTLDLGFEDGSAAFFHRGTSGRWAEQLDADLLRRHSELVARELPDPVAQAWIERGSLALGRRPDEA